MRRLLRYQSRLFSTLHQHRISIFGDQVIELSMPFPPHFETTKLFLHQDFTFSNLVKAISYNEPMAKVRVINSATKEPIDLEERVVSRIRGAEKFEFSVIVNETDEFVYSNFQQKESQSFSELPPSEFGPNLRAALEEAHVPRDMSAMAAFLALKVKALVPELEGRSLAEAFDQSKTNFLQYDVVEDMISKLHRRKLNALQSIEAMKQLRDEIFKVPDRRSKLYLKGILLLTMGQWAFFFYTVFFVDWLGWDIMEPITYSIEAASLAFALRFFYKHKTSRSYDRIFDMLRRKHLRKNPMLAIRVEQLNEDILNLEKEVKNIDLYFKINSTGS